MVHAVPPPADFLLATSRATPPWHPPGARATPTGARRGCPLVVRRAVNAASALLVAGCATFSPDGGRGDLERLAAERIGPTARALDVAAQDEAARRAFVDARLAQALTPDTAVEVALVQQPGLQAKLAELGIAEADLVQTGRLRNPMFVYSNKRGGGIVDIERALMINVASLVTMPLALDLEKQRFEQAKLVAASEVVESAAAVRRAWVRAVAAQERLAYDEQVLASAEAAGELARRLAEAGNLSPLAQMREQAFRADAAAGLARARHDVLAGRERLARLLGQPDADARLKLPARLPDPPAAPLVSAVVEQAAMDRRLDVQVAKADTEAVARALGLTRATRFVNVLEVGYANTSTTGEARQNGYEIEVELPLFDFGDAKLARAEARYRQALARTADVALAARAEVREAYSAYRTSWELAKLYRDEVVPLRKRISEEMLLRYNGMLSSVFELLADARVQAASVAAAIEANRDYWLAENELQLALAGRSSPALAAASRAAARPAESAGGH